MAGDCAFHLPTFSSMAPSLFNWGAPVDITMPPSGDGTVPPWTDLTFNPLGLYNLCRRIGILAGEPGIFTRYQSHFKAADVAWFAAGASEDNNHYIPANTFHQAFAIWQRRQKVVEAGAVTSPKNYF